jgi:hypothetical protein
MLKQNVELVRRVFAELAADIRVNDVDFEKEQPFDETRGRLPHFPLQGQRAGEPRCRTSSGPLARGVASRHRSSPGEARVARLATRFCYHAA